MTHDRMYVEPVSEQRTPAEHWYLHFYVGLLLGSLTIVLTAFLHWLPAVTAMDRLGDDVAQRIYAGGLHRAPVDVDLRLTLLDMKFADQRASDSEVDQITRAIGILARFQPRAIIIDQEILDTVDPEKKSAFLDAVKAAASATPAPITIVLVPVQRPGSKDDGARAVVMDGPVNLLHDLHTDHVVFASPLLQPETDGVIRFIDQTVCLKWPGKTEAQMVPTLATSLSETAKPGCEDTKPAKRILFTVGPSNATKSPALKWLAQGDLNDPDKIAKAVRGAVLLIGEVEPSAGRDYHETPLGQMPGVLIHANALLSPANLAGEAHMPSTVRTLFVALGCAVAIFCFGGHYVLWRQERVQGLAVWISVAAVAVVLAGAVPAVGGTLMSGHPDAAESIKLGMEVAGVIAAASLFAWQDRAARYLAKGRGETASVGIWLAFFAAAAGLCLTSLGFVWLLFGALLIPLGLQVGSLMPVLAASLEALVKAGENVVKLLEIPVRFLMRRASNFLFAVLVLGAAPGLSAEPATQAASERPPGLVGRTVTAFVGLLAGQRPPKAPGWGVGTVARGDGPDVALQWLQAVPVEGAKLPAGVQGLCLVWAGGTPPFVISLQARSGAALGAFRTAERVVSRPNFTMPGEPVVMSVADAQGARLSATVDPSAVAAPDPVPPPDSAAPARVAMALFVGGGQPWRLEALRRLAALAPTDKEAAEALAELRRTADAGSPQ